MPEKLNQLIDSKDVKIASPSTQSKLKREIFNEDFKEVRDYAIKDLIIPGIKNWILNLLEMSFFGKTSNSYRRYERWSNNNSYRNDFYDDGSSHYNYNGSPISSSKKSRYQSSKPDYRNIIINDKLKAERVLQRLHLQILERGSVTVANLYELIGIIGDYTDNDWGWNNRSDISIRRVRDGYLIDVSEPKYLG